MVDVPNVGRHAKAAALVWDYEVWRCASPAEQLEMRTQLAQPGLVRLAGSAAVVEMLDAMSLSSRGPFPPGIDTKMFVVRREPETRRPSVGFLYRPGPHRGLEDLLAALEQLRGKGVDVEVTASGRPFGREVPRWIGWRSCPSDEELADFYNDVSVFVLPSHFEGLGLPAIEAMACGAAVVTTDNAGSRQFAHHEQNAFVVSPGRPDQLAAGIERLLLDDELRLDLAHAGRATAETMDWQTTIDDVERELLQL
jgi:glycosyltransferase involved in cell wall biosynthesis